MVDCATVAAAAQEHKRKRCWCWGTWRDFYSRDHEFRSYLAVAQSSSPNTWKRTDDDDDGGTLLKRKAWRHAPVRILAREIAMQRGPTCRCMAPLLRLAIPPIVRRRYFHDHHARAAFYYTTTMNRKSKTKDKRAAVDENDTHTMPIRLSKRMSELGICSRREAARILSKCNGNSSLKDLKEVVFLRGVPVMDGAAVKVSPDEKYIEIRTGGNLPGETIDGSSCEGMKEFVPYPDRPWEEIMGDTIVLHKPIGYVSGQEEHQHVPAVRLLNRENMQLYDFDRDMQDVFKNGNALHFDRWKFSGFDVKANSIPKHIRMTLDEEQLKEKNNVLDIQTLSGYAPAGRLDIDSTGVLLFTRAGIVARRLIEPDSKIPKEYIVTVEPAVQLSAWERGLSIKSLPRPTRDLSVLLRNGNRLAGEKNPLKPLVSAEWLDINDESTEGSQHRQTRTMRLVLLEGKKRQVRRVCREILGWHVVKLCRASVGPVKIGTLPEGKWRPLTQTEVKSIFKDKHYAPFKRTTSVDQSSMESLEDDNIATKNILPETKVMREVVEALKREPTGWLSITTLQKQVGKRLNFLPKKEGMRKKWKEQLLQICRDNSARLIFRGTQNVGLRIKVGIDRNDCVTNTVDKAKTYT